MIGLTGPHRCGKTTLAKAYSEAEKVPFVQTSASGVFKQMGLSPKADYSLDTRIEIQENILTALTEQWRSAGEGIYITDRTPIDLMAYTLADVPREPLPDATQERLTKYMNNCRRVLNENFSVIVLMQQGIHLVDEVDKAPIGQGYMDHIKHLMWGIAASNEVLSHQFYMPKRTIDLQERVKCVNYALKRALHRHQELVAASTDSEGYLKSIN